MATPPCSYTGVRDVVDLAVARGGDTNLLESLTSDTAGAGIKRPRALLAEQFSTLKYALTRPNIQFLIYEVHTILPSETTEMIRQVVEYANQLATEKYIREHLVSERTFLLSSLVLVLFPICYYFKFADQTHLTFFQIVHL